MCVHSNWSASLNGTLAITIKHMGINDVVMSIMKKQTKRHGSHKNQNETVKESVRGNERERARARVRLEWKGRKRTSVVQSFHIFRK